MWRQIVRGYWISNPVQVCSGPQTPLYIPPHRHGLQISEPSLDLPTTWQTCHCGKTFWTHYIFILLPIRLSHYQATLLFITSAISMFRFIIPQPSRDPHPFLFGSPARWVLFISWFVIYLNFGSPASSSTVALTQMAVNRSNWRHKDRRRYRRYRSTQLSYPNIVWSSVIFRAIQNPLVTFISLGHVLNMFWSCHRCLIPNIAHNLIRLILNK